MHAFKRQAVADTHPEYMGEESSGLPEQMKLSLRRLGLSAEKTSPRRIKKEMIRCLQRSDILFPNPERYTNFLLFNEVFDSAEEYYNVIEAARDEFNHMFTVQLLEQMEPEQVVKFIEQGPGKEAQLLECLQLNVRLNLPEILAQRQGQWGGQWADSSDDSSANSLDDSLDSMDSDVLDFEDRYRKRGGRPEYGTIEELSDAELFRVAANWDRKIHPRFVRMAKEELQRRQALRRKPLRARRMVEDSK
jgi:hypothetical protein